MEPSHDRLKLSAKEIALVLIFLIAFSAMVVRNAWLSDDAYITFRTVDNFVNGYGLTWNVAERVQVYTHPLWMFLLSGIYFVTREIFFSSLALSIGLSLAAVTLLTTRLARSIWLALTGVAIFTLSKAFIDYATSGLENPLAHVLLALFLIVYLKDDFTPTSSFILALLAALGMVNRLDTMLLYAPALVYALIRARSLKALGMMVLGALPVVLWELFSLFYYGVPFPNTAYAKLTSALISRQDLMREGLNYLTNSAKADTITLFATGLGVLLPLITKTWRKLPIAMGVGLYLLYVVYVGGDFMSGRFLTAPLFAAVALVVNDRRFAKSNALQSILLAVVVLVGMSAPYSPIVASGEKGAQTGTEVGWVRGRSIVDERANYYRNTGLLRALQTPHRLPDHDWAVEGRAAREAGPAVIEMGSVGFFGFFAGPDVYVVDMLGLGNPLLARLPLADPDWSIGHFGRLMPAGYHQTLETGENVIENPHLALYYAKLELIIRGDLFDPERLREIWRFNTGVYDADLDAYAYFRGSEFAQSFLVTNPTDRPYVYTYVWNNGSGEVLLLDDASYPGKTHAIAWHVLTSGVRFDAPFLQRLSAIGPLSDAETLNIGVLFSPTPDLTTQDKYEYRFWFHLDDNATFTVILPGKGFHNAGAPQDFWIPTDLHPVMHPQLDPASWPSDQDGY